ncbi:MAG: penicillin-binding protein 1C [Burkholderiales bacterium]
MTSRAPRLPALAFAVALAWGEAAAAVAGAAPDTTQSVAWPTFAQVRAAYVPSDAVLLDRQGAPLAAVRIDAKARRGEWVALADVSPAMSAALIAAEDKRFYEHGGVDWTGLASAAWDSVWRAADGKRLRGGSTLTMQLAGLLDPALRPAGHDERTLAQKWDQIEAARALERTWTKNEILEAYLNLSTYRGELTGLRAAAQGLFGKTPSGLDAREAAILVALLRAPAAKPTLVAQRACAVAAVASPDAACEPIRALANVALAGGARAARSTGLAPHLAVRLAKTPGERVPSTLDGELQAFAVATLRDHLVELAARGVEDGAIVVLDNATGEVLAYVGSSGELSQSPEVDGAAAPRQAGSTLKPFLYALAIDQRVLTAASLVDDSPLAIPTARGMYVPQNYDRDFRGSVSVRTALASSLNVPAVRTLELMGVDRFHETLRNAGLATLTEAPDYYGAALALGGADVTLVALTNAYRALANGGVATPVRYRKGAANDAAEAPRRVVGADAAFIVGDILADRGARAATFGLENPLATRLWSAAKTGTSKDMRDNWCIGWTARYTVGVWVGNFSGAPMHDVSGVTGAAPMWRDLVHFLHRAQRSLPPAAPATLAASAVAFDPPVEPPRTEWFVRGTAQAVVRSVAAAPDDDALPAPKIRYPAPDTIIALDPDIPPAHQRVAFASGPLAHDVRWRVDDDELPDRGPRALWAPVPGRHVVMLVDGDGKVLSRVAFEVRGNLPRIAAAP